MPSTTSELVSFFGSAFGAGIDDVLKSVQLSPAGGISDMKRRKKKVRGGKSASLGGGKTPKPKRSRRKRLSMGTDPKSRRLKRRGASPVRRRLYSLRRS